MNLPVHRITLNRQLLYDWHRLSHQQIDDFLGEKESKNYISEKLEQMKVLHEFLVVTDEFKVAGIPFISIKGPLLSYRLYNDASYRRYKDFDFLMKISDIEKGMDVLNKLGYQSTQFKWPEDMRRKNLIIKHDKHIEIYHPGKKISIELHWKLFNVRIAKAETLNKVISANLTMIEFTGRKFTVFNVEFELLYLIIHGGLSNWFRLKWLVDIHQLLNIQSIDSKKFTKITSLLKADRMVALCNSILKKFYPSDKILPVKINSVPALSNFALKRINQTDSFGYNTFGQALQSLRISLISFPGYKYKYDVLKAHLFYNQEIDNRNIPPYSIVYYFLGVTKRFFFRLKSIFHF